MSPSEDTVKTARSMFLRGERVGAQNLLNGILAEDPHNGRAWEMLGAIHHSQGAVEEAIYALEEATALRPLTVGGQFAIADCYLAKGHVDAAEVVYQDLADGDRLPDNLLPDVVRALDTIGDYSRALRLSRRAMKKVPTCADAHYGVGYYLTKLGHKSESVLPYFSRAVQLAPENVSYRVTLASLYLQLGKGDEAFNVLGSLTSGQLSLLHCPNCIQKFADVYEAFGDLAKRDVCLARIRQLD